MFFMKKKKIPKIPKKNISYQQDIGFENDFAQEKRLYDFKENMKKLSKDENSAMILAKQLSRLIQKS
ncbi:molybdenum cofactor biosynthesis protein [Campylobacter armoricus]|uniref:molybdenum cofactor biosynthesis protein n=1 Tax=Campylobacter armoricus TaxID=2505970 RepID=UPI001116909B|nr:molybdenum cofactor biosynthesis protein [Campylobacter armoricus]